MSEVQSTPPQGLDVSQTGFKDSLREGGERVVTVGDDRPRTRGVCRGTGRPDGRVPEDAPDSVRYLTLGPRPVKSPLPKRVGGRGWATKKDKTLTHITVVSNTVE